MRKLLYKLLIWVAKEGQDVPFEEPARERTTRLEDQPISRWEFDNVRYKVTNLLNRISQIENHLKIKIVRNNYQVKPLTEEEIKTREKYGVNETPGSCVQNSPL